MLRQWSACPTCVASGPEALDELRRAASANTPYSLVLLDAMMPEMDGFAVAEQIAREPGVGRPALLVHTSGDRHGHALRCRHLGLPAPLVKPIKPSQLYGMITATLRNDPYPLAAPPLDPPAIRPEAKEQSRDKIRLVRIARVSPVPARPLRILLAEDNALNQRVALRLLEKEGHVVTIANHGGEVLKAMESQHFDVILMDVQMPEVDGFEATHEIRAREAGSATQTFIVAMTAHAMKGDRERCLAEGMDDYLSKPVQRSDLVRILQPLAARQCGRSDQPAGAPNGR
jgi:CheY-like chemotaxis protein